MGWAIRSQGKETIELVSNFHYAFVNDEHLIRTRIGLTYHDSLVTHNLVLGKFPTKEAALEELDRIEQWIANGAKYVYAVSGE